MLSLHQSAYHNLVSLIKNDNRAFLLMGTRGIGKRVLVQRVITDIGATLTSFEQFRIDDARSLRDISLRKTQKVQSFVINGDGATEQSYNAILKLLEEPPVGNLYFIVSSSSPLPTITSRCNCLIIPKLNDVELIQVLRYKGMSERLISQVVKYADGSVSQAFKIYESLENRVKMVPFLKALRDGDFLFVLSKVSKMGSCEIGLLKELLDDLLLARYGLRFVDDLPMQVTPDFIEKIKSALNAGRAADVAWLRAWFTLQ